MDKAECEAEAESMRSWRRKQLEAEDEIKLARERIHLVEKYLFQMQCAAIDLTEHLDKVAAELSGLKAEREKVANGKLNCVECGSILARW